MNRELVHGEEGDVCEHNHQRRDDVERASEGKGGGEAISNGETLLHLDARCWAQTEAEYQAERQEMMQAHLRHKRDLEDINAAMEAEFRRIEAEAEQEFEAERTDIKNRAQEDYHVMRIQLNGQIEDAEQSYDKMYKTYMQSTEERTAQFQKMAQSDKDDAREIEREMNRLLRLQQSVAHWRMKTATNIDDWKERNTALREEKEVMTRHYAKLKSQMDRMRRQQQTRLKELSKHSGSAMDSLKSKIALAERILKLAEFCRRLETEVRGGSVGVGFKTEVMRRVKNGVRVETEVMERGQRAGVLDEIEVKMGGKVWGCVMGGVRATSR